LLKDRPRARGARQRTLTPQEHLAVHDLLSPSLHCSRRYYLEENTKPIKLRLRLINHRWENRGQGLAGAITALVEQLMINSSCDRRKPAHYPINTKHRFVKPDKQVPPISTGRYAYLNCKIFREGANRTRNASRTAERN